MPICQVLFETRFVFGIILMEVDTMSQCICHLHLAKRISALKTKHYMMVRILQTLVGSPTEVVAIFLY
ncbi:MAG: hypothetical protein CMI60_20585 [Parvibaculum sp.]|nr:hypothetical protein [Parvibaculum sp.]